MVIQTAAWLYRFLHGYTNSCMVIQIFAWLYKQLHGYTDCCMVLQSTQLSINHSSLSNIHRSTSIYSRTNQPTNILPTLQLVQTSSQSHPTGSSSIYNHQTNRPSNTQPAVQPAQSGSTAYQTGSSKVQP